MLILVADDDSETCALVSDILKTAGYATALARDAMQTMAVANSRSPGLILLDIQMPAGTGIGALEKLKRSTRTAHIPVIVLSGTNDAQKIEQVKRLGAAEFLPKPVDPDALLAAVRRATAAEP